MKQKLYVVQLPDYSNRVKSQIRDLLNLYCSNKNLQKELLVPSFLSFDIQKTINILITKV